MKLRLPLLRKFDLRQLQKRHLTLPLCPYLRPQRTTTYRSSDPSAGCAETGGSEARGALPLREETPERAPSSIFCTVCSHQLQQHQEPAPKIKIWSLLLFVGKRHNKDGILLQRISRLGPAGKLTSGPTPPVRSTTARSARSIGNRNNGSSSNNSSIISRSLSTPICLNLTCRMTWRSASPSWKNASASSTPSRPWPPTWTWSGSLCRRCWCSSCKVGFAMVSLALWRVNQVSTCQPLFVCAGRKIYTQARTPCY